MKLKYIGMISPVNLYQVMDGKNRGKSIVTGEVFEVDPQHAAELMARFNEKGKKEKFIEAGSEKIAKPGKPAKKPVANTKDIDLEI